MNPTGLDPSKQYTAPETKGLFGDQPLIGGFTIGYGGQNYKIINNGNGTSSFAPVASGEAGGGRLGGDSGIGGVDLSGSFTQPTLNLSDLYKSLYTSSGITNLQDQLTKNQEALNKETSVINDNPFLSEANRTGRIAKLTTDFQNSAKPIQDQLSQKTADINTQLGLATKQFDINSSQVQQAQQQFNILLQLGALDNASPSDIAKITQSTGIPSSMIQSAIQTRVNAQKASIAKENAPIPHVITSTDNNGNVTVNVIDERTGKVINTQSLGAIDKTTKPSGNGPSNTVTLTPTQQRQVTASATKALTSVDINKDKLVSLQEYQKALKQVVTATGVDVNTADNYLTAQMEALNYGKWRW